MKSEALKLFWAITWRWTLLSLLLMLPVFYLRTIPHSPGLSELYTWVEVGLTFFAFYVVILRLLTQGFGGKRLDVSDKEA